MLNSKVEISRQYMEAVFRRARSPMEPRDFSPNWADQPSRYKIYRDVERIPLPAQLPTQLASIGQIMKRFTSPVSAPRVLGYSELATLLLYSHGVLNRRLDITWNRDSRDKARYYQATFGRGTASGGGMYPTEIFWICGQSSDIQPGIYHYDNAHHALARLFVGDITEQIHSALYEHPAALATDQFLLISLNFWKNSFKYNSFCYHVVTEDLGALLGSLRAAALGFGVDFPFLFWYQDEKLNRLLGLETLSESVFAVIPLPGKGGQGRTNKRGEEQSSRENLSVSLVAKQAFQRSREIISFPAVETVHKYALIDQEPPSDWAAKDKASCDEFVTQGTKIHLPLPSSELLRRDLLDIFRNRQSSFGRFSSHKPLLLSEFATQLFFASASLDYISDAKEGEHTPHFTRLMAFVNNVEGLQRGAYAYEWKRHCLWVVDQQDFSSFLQEHYFLRNYNLAEVAALLVIVGKPEPMLEIYGNRGYRILNAEVGLVAQNVYLISTALGVNCGAALGFDNIALNQALGLDASDERSILLLLVGHGQAEDARFAAQLL